MKLQNSAATTCFFECCDFQGTLPLPTLETFHRLLDSWDHEAFFCCYCREATELCTVAEYLAITDFVSAVCGDTLTLDLKFRRLTNSWDNLTAKEKRNTKRRYLRSILSSMKLYT